MELLFVLSSLAAFFIRAKRKIVENVVPSAFNFLFNVDLLRYIFFDIDSNVQFFLVSA